MFKELLKEVVDGVDGGLATLIMDLEGITLDSYAKPGSGDFDIQTIGAEYSVILKSIQKAAAMLESGEPQEITIQAGKVTTLVRVVTPTYFVAFTLATDANLGKARYLLRVKAPVLAKELS
jgi:predicted regulator of Ras-like GTPase activity (Roadblock/LC7/MglB family)